MPAEGTKMKTRPWPGRWPLYGVMEKVKEAPFAPSLRYACEEDCRLDCKYLRYACEETANISEYLRYACEEDCRLDVCACDWLFSSSPLRGEQKQFRELIL